MLKNMVMIIDDDNDDTAGDDNDDTDDDDDDIEAVESGGATRDATVSHSVADGTLLTMIWMFQIECLSALIS